MRLSVLFPDVYAFCPFANYFLICRICKNEKGKGNNIGKKYKCISVNRETGDLLEELHSSDINTGN